MSADLLLGLDLGTSTCKALLLDASGTEVAVAAAPTPFASSESLIEMRVEDLRGTAAGLVSALGAERRRVAAVGIAGMAECGAPLDRSGAVLAPVISWHDPRGEDVVRRLTEAFGDSLGLRTGQRPRAVSSVAKLGWLVANGCGPVERWLGVPELCLWDLTGTQATEHSLASRTGCYDVLEGVYLPDVAEAAGFSAEVFAEVRRAGDPMGRVPAGAASRWGLPEGVPVPLAGQAHLSGPVGAGARPGGRVNSVGTAETVLGYAGRSPDLGRALELRTPVSVAPGGRGWVVLAGAARAGVVLAAAAPLLGRSIPELDAMAEATDGSVDGAALAEALQAGAPVLLPGDPPGAIWKGLLIALAARTAEAAGRVRSLGVPSDRMLVIGGGSASVPWMRAKGEAIPLPLLRPRTSQAVGRGAAVFAGVAAGWWASPSGAPALGTEAVP